MYNGVKISELYNKLPKQMGHTLKTIYIETAKEVIKNEAAKINLGWCVVARNTNNALVKRALSGELGGPKFAFSK